MSQKRKKFAQLDDYILIKTLGSGYSAKVRLAYHESSKKYYAIKIIHCKSHLDSNIKAIFNEISLLSQFSHENIVNLLKYNENAVYIKKNGETYPTKYAVLELAAYGEFFSYISAGGPLPEPVCRAYFLDLLSTLEYCHKMGVAHRDLKPENLLLDENFTLKLSDFGFSAYFSRKLVSKVGTKLYQAPEIHCEAAYCGPSVDLFACGIILFMMFTGLQPFEIAATQRDTFYKLFYQNNVAKYWETVGGYMGKNYAFPADFKEIVSALLSVDATHRPSLAELRNMAWLRGEVASKKDVLQEMSRRTPKVEREREKERLEKDLEKQKQRFEEEQSQIIASGAKKPQLVNQPMVGNKIYRGENDNSEKSLEKTREIFVCNREENAIGNRCFGFTCKDKGNAQELFVFLSSLLRNRCTETELDDSFYKIKGKFVHEVDNLEIVAKLWECEGNLCVELCKKQGPSMQFFAVCKEIKENLEKVF